jgi:hypothetical protein
MRLLVRSFVCCVLATGAYGQVTVVYPPSAPASNVILVLDNPAPRPAEFLPTPRQISYLIAFKDSEVRVADQYWVSGRTIFYLTPDRLKLSAPLSSVDRTLSERLNGERNVAFVLPLEPRRTVAQAHLVRRTASTARKRCNCVSAPSARVSPRTSGAASRSTPGTPAE